MNFFNLHASKLLENTNNLSLLTSFFVLAKTLVLGYMDVRLKKYFHKSKLSQTIGYLGIRNPCNKGIENKQEKKQTVKHNLLLVITKTLQSPKAKLETY
jgi:hypothetical protein